MNTQKPMRIVGRRKSATGLRAADGLQRLAQEFRGGKPFAPRGLYRFQSHEEADQWMLKMLTRPSAGCRR